MKSSFFFTIAAISLATVSCTPKTHSPDFSNRKPFKYTITTDVAGNSKNVETLVALNTVNDQLPAVFDLDCDGDGKYEFTGLTGNQKCVYERNTGNHQIWVRGNIPAMYLCANRSEMNKPLIPLLLILDASSDLILGDVQIDELCNDSNALNDYINSESELTGSLLRSYCKLPADIKDTNGDRSDNGKAKVISIDDWGDIQWQSMNSFAFYCNQLETVPKDAPDLSHVTDATLMFAHCTKFNQPIENWDVSSVKTMTAMFYGGASFNQPLEKWNVSNVTDMTAMFSANNVEKSPIPNQFNQPLNNWNLSNVKSIRGMFYGGASFNQPLDKWNVSNVTDMNSTFAGAASFNQPLDKWDVSNVTDMSSMFAAATSFNQPLNNWDVSHVSNMQHMFSNAISFDQPLNNWDLSSVTDMSFMFYNATAFNQPLNNWNISNVTNMNFMFKNAAAFSYYPENWVIPANCIQTSIFKDTPVEQIAAEKPLKTEIRDK